MFTSRKSNDYKEVTPRSVTMEISQNRPFKIWIKEYGIPYLIIILVSAACAFFLSPKSSHPTIDTKDIKVGTIAAKDYKAWQEMTVLDEELTKTKREEAANAVRPCYNLNSNKSINIRHQLVSSFEAMRNEIVLLNQELNTHDATTEGTTDESVRPTIVPTYEQKQERYLTKIEDFRKGMQQRISDEQFKVLAATDFALNIQELTLAALNKLMPSDRPIIKNKFLLSDQLGQGIIILGNSTISHDTPYAFDKLVDLDDLKADTSSVLDGLNQGAKAVSPEIIDVVTIIIQNWLDSTIEENVTETTLRRNRATEVVPPSANSYSTGQIICRAGEPISREQLLALNQLSKMGEQKHSTSAQVVFGLFLAVLCFIFITLQYWNDDFWKIQINIRDLGFFSLLTMIGLVFLLICGWIGSTDKVANAAADPGNGLQLETLVFLMPFPSLVMTMRSILGRSKALIFTMTITLLTALCFNGNSSISYLLYITAGSLVGGWCVAHSTERSYVFKSGVAIIIANILIIFAITAYNYNPLNGGLQVAQMGWNILSAIICGTLSAFLYTALIPAMETLFGYVTDVRLLELGNLNHPLLRKLMVEAPGTYHHSVMVDLLAEAVAPTIGANPLKVRVMAYFHDVGKMKNPRYFAENQSGENPHENMKPIMSARVLKSHVIDGVKLAQEYRLGELVEAAIMEHHGTTRVGFYNKAKGLETPEDPVNENDYRYAGPIPQTKETALLMLADSVEAAVKSIKEPNRDRIMNMVTKVINGKFTDEQLNDCDLTLRDLHIIAKSFTDTLTGMNYSRPEYASTSNISSSTRNRDLNSLKEGKTNKDLKPEVKEDKEGEKDNKLVTTAKDEDNVNSDQKQTKRPESHLYITENNSSEGIKHLGQI